MVDRGDLALRLRSFSTEELAAEVERREAVEYRAGKSFLVRITKGFGWYENRVGEEYEVRDQPHAEAFYSVVSGPNRNFAYSINIDDCERV